MDVRYQSVCTSRDAGCLILSRSAEILEHPCELSTSDGLAIVVVSAKSFLWLPRRKVQTQRSCSWAYGKYESHWPLSCLQMLPLDSDLSYSSGCYHNILQSEFCTVLERETISFSVSRDDCQPLGVNSFSSFPACLWQLITSSVWCCLYLLR